MIEHNDTTGAGRATDAGEPMMPKALVGMRGPREIHAAIDQAKQEARDERQAARVIDREFDGAMPTDPFESHQRHTKKAEMADDAVRALYRELWDNPASALTPEQIKADARAVGDAPWYAAGAATPEEVRRMAALADPARIVGYAFGDEDSAGDEDEPVRAGGAWRVLLGIAGIVAVLALPSLWEGLVRWLS